MCGSYSRLLCTRDFGVALHSAGFIEILDHNCSYLNTVLEMSVYHWSLLWIRTSYVGHHLNIIIQEFKLNLMQS